MVRECVVGGGSLRLEGRFCVGGRVTHVISNFWVELWFGKFLPAINFAESGEGFVCHQDK